MATVIIRPASDTYIAPGTINSDSGTSNLYSYVNEETLDTGGYITNTGAGSVSQVRFSWTSSGLTSETINKITVVAYGYTYFDYLYDGGYVSMGSGYPLSYDLTTNPETSSAWTVSDLNNLDAGIRFQHSDNKEYPIAFQLYIEVDYTASSGPTYTLECSSGSFVLTGQSAGLLHNRILSVDSGAFDLTGQDAGLLHNRVLFAGSGAFVLAGDDVGLTFGIIIITPDERAYVILIENRTKLIDTEVRIFTIPADNRTEVIT